MAVDIVKIGTRDCQKWSDEIFIRHSNIGKILRARYERTARSFGHVSANRELAKINESLILYGKKTCALDDQEICDLASVCAIQAEGIFKAEAKRRCMAVLSYALEDYCSSRSVVFPFSVARKDSGSDIARKIINAAKRVSCPRWWRRQLRVVCSRRLEGVLRGLGLARVKTSPYISRYSFMCWQKAQLRNKKLIARLNAVTEIDGEEVAVDLQGLIDQSISNPEKRLHEMMTGSRGFQEIAEGLGLVCAMFTLTAPSRFHSQRARGGANKKYDGSTPIDVMKHLNKMWSLIRSAWAKGGIKTFGFRVAEPHHDGTPHFHMALYFGEGELGRAQEIFKKFALLVDGDEDGASAHRWDCVVLPAGAATAYLAKYVSKNINGEAIEIDFEGQCHASEGAARVRAWASVWGIRQFQQIGSVSVTVWRELRRCREAFDDLTPEQVEPLREAADRGDWKEFVELMGGVFVGRSDQALRPAYVESECVTSLYGEGVKRLIGVWLNPVVNALGRCMVPTRDKVWSIREKERVSALKVAKPPP